MSSKDQILHNLKSQWKSNVAKQYKKEPEKVKNSDVEKNTNEIMSNQTAASTMAKAGITREDILTSTYRIGRLSQATENGVSTIHTSVRSS